MAIMVAGGLTFAIPGTDPVFAEVTTSNPHLYVSAEGQDPDNMFAEGNIIEVIIRDDTIGDTDEGEAEPEVTVNGADLRMLQTANGYWTAYFAEEDALAGIDSLDYGVYCSETQASTVTALELSDGNGIYLPPGSDCSDSNAGTGIHPLIREPRDLTNYNGHSLGQLGLSNANLWPFIQVFDFTSLSDVDIVYNKGGTRESVTLTFDDPSESHTLDRQKYPQSAHVHITLEDYALNIDPTDEDAWVFDTQNGVAYYNVFDEDGTPVNAANPVSVGSEAGIDETVSIIRGAQGTNVIDCQVTKDFGIQLEDDASRDYLMVDDDGACVPNELGAGASAVFAPGTFAIGFVEDGSNNNVFINWAEDQRSNIVVKDDAPRGNSFEVDYSSPDAKSGVVGHFFADLALDVSDGTWNSGERIPIVLTDMDANVNPLAEDDLTVANPHSLLVPSIRIGSPVTLASADGDVVWFDIPVPDETAPMITLSDGGAPLPFGDPRIETGVTCTDDRDGTLTATNDADTAVDPNTVGAYTVTYTCTDHSGNVATATRTVNVPDSTPPTITLQGPSPATVNVGGIYTDAGALCSDPVDGTLSVTNDAATAVDTSSRGTYTVTYTCIDHSGNEATATRTVVVTDSDSPTIVIRGPASVEVPQGSTYTDAGAECVDNADPNPRLSTGGQVNTDILGTYSVTYTCQDSDGNIVTANRVVIVATPDTTAPTLTLNGPSAISVLQGAPAYTDAGATCTDDRDPSPEQTDTSAVVNTAIVGTYTVVYTCTDASGNAAPPVTRTVNVTEPDTAPPTIAVDPDTVSVVQNRNYTAADAVFGVTCTDTNDPSPTLTADISAVDTATLGDYTVLYACTDASTNAATATRTVTVVEADKVVPTITLNGPPTIDLIEGQTYTERDAECTDETDGELRVTIGGDTVDTTTAGQYTVTYTCTDSSDNPAKIERTVNVIADLTLFSVTASDWDDGRLTLDITGKTALPGVMLDSSADIAGFPVRVAAEFGTGNIDQTVTIDDISINGNTGFYLTATGGVQSNTQMVDIPNALGLTGVTIKTDLVGEPTSWEFGEISLNITGTVGVSSVSLVTSDGTLVAAEVPITNTTTGSIDSTDASMITLDNISLAGKTVQFALKSGDVTSSGTADTTDIPLILNLTSIDFTTDDTGIWANGILGLTLQGFEEVNNIDSENYVNLVAMTADGYQQVAVTDDVTTIVDEQVSVTDIRLAGSTEFRLNFTDASGNNTMSNPQTLDIPKILELDAVGLPGDVASFTTWPWTANGLSLSINGTANMTAPDANTPILLTINDEKTTTTVNELNTAVSEGLGRASVLLTDSTLQNERVQIGVTYTDAEDRTVTDTLVTPVRLAPTDLNLVSVTPGVWNITADASALPLMIEGNVGNIVATGVELVVNDAATGLVVTNGTDGKITAVADLTDIGVSGMTNFTLRTGSAATNTMSNTVQADVPPAFKVEDVQIDRLWFRNSGDAFSSLSLRVTGYENVTTAVNIAAFPPTGTAVTLTTAAVTGNATTGALDETVALGAADPAGFTQYSNQDINIHLTTDGPTNSENFTITVPSALILDDLTVDRTTLGKMRLMTTGSSFLDAGYNNVVLAMYESMDADNVLIPKERMDIDVTDGERNPDGSFPIEGTNVLDATEDAKVSGMTVYIRLEATAGTNTVHSDIYRVSLPATGSSNSVDMTPKPASFSHSSGFPPITKAVINDISAIPAVHNVQSSSQDPVAMYTWPGDADKTVEAFSDRLRLYEPGVKNAITGHSKIVIYGWEPPTFADGVTTLFNWNFGSILNDGVAPGATITDIRLANADHSKSVSLGNGASGLEDITAMKAAIEELGSSVDLVIMLANTNLDHVCGDITLVADFFTFGQNDDDGRVNNAIYRIEVEEASSNSDLFEGTVEYTMLNQLNIDDPATYTGLRPISDQISIIIHEDFTDEDSVRVNYLDLGADGVSTQIAIQQAAPTHSAVVSFDSESYKIADTVTITLEDADLNVKNDVIDIYTFSSVHTDTIGDDGAYILDVTFDDELWTSGTCEGADGFASTGFTLQETASNSGVFTGDFQIPEYYCQAATGEMVSVTGVDIEVNYQDFRDASGEEIEVGAGAAVRANTGTVSLDRTVYPVPFAADTFEHTNGYLGQHDLTVHVTIDDPDFDISAAGEDVISNATAYLTVEVIRGSASHTIDLEDAQILETAPDSGAFELDLPLTYSDGPDGSILQGDILQVEYRDPTDASGEENTVTDSATFDLRNGVLQSDKSVYIIGSDMILTLIEPDFDLENDGAESYTLNLIEWDSDAATLGMADPDHGAAFDPEPSELRETGDSTGIFQVIVEIPAEIDGDRLERGEEIELEYVDWGPSGADYVGDESEDVTLTVYTSNFGATIELDQKVYTWTDKVYITIVAPDHNFDSALVDEIGDSNLDPIQISTRSADIDNYKLVETGPDTGIFTGEVILIGFDHNADGDTETGTDVAGYDNPQRDTSDDKSGPTNGYLKTDDDDGITVSFEYSEDETVVGSALIRWNIGEVQWLESSYPASGTGVVRVIDPDMNWNPEAVNNFVIDVWSDADNGGIDLTVTETNEATGIFEGTVFFTITDESSGHRLRVAEGNTVTAEYEDNTLPDPYTTADELDITATTLIGTIVPPLERAPATNLRIVDAFGNSLDTVSADQQVQIVADLANGQDRSQAFAYLVQVQDSNGVTVALSWISGTLEAGQSLSPSTSWIPSEAGTYTATAFVWESVDNPTALSPPVTTDITVS